jgi:hypothetical protein
VIHIKTELNFNPPPVGSEKREDMPSHVFLMPDERKYPVKEKRNGEWVYTKTALRSAISVANMQGDVSVSRKAQELLAKLHEENGTSELNASTDIMALKYRISSLLYKNHIGENQALEGYAKLIKDMIELGETTSDTGVHKLINHAVGVVQEICEDEKNHRMNLIALEYTFDQIQISPDGMVDVLNDIVNSIGSSS